MAPRGPGGHRKVGEGNPLVKDLGGDVLGPVVKANRGALELNEHRGVLLGLIRGIHGPERAPPEALAIWGGAPGLA